jgi:UDP-N-acetylmuramate: L-alanyl-gamma-D-glutamyl-meso-diaminopimelate ligase
MTSSKIHFIAIGGAAMHALAIALKVKGYRITGSDDEIFEPSRSRLKLHGLLPEKSGWFPLKITADTDAVILGMHAHKDNPELLQALKLGIKVYSYPAYVLEQTLRKKRVVIAGSHGKTTITSMIMHVLRFNNVVFDYLVGSGIEGFDNTVGLENKASIAIFEGDEYPASALDTRPKFHIYKPHIALVSGIAWDHVNVFPSYDLYKKQFEIFISQLPDNGILVYCEADKVLKSMVEESSSGALKIPYRAHPYRVRDEKTYLLAEGKELPLEVFGNHNLQNISGAKLVCEKLGIPSEAFYRAIVNFKGAGKRLQELVRNRETIVYLDFAHSPSKVKATIDAVKEQYPSRKLFACLELHTYSSLTKTFLAEYRNTMEKADDAIVFFNPETLVQKRLEIIKPEDVSTSFGRDKVTVYTSPVELKEHLICRHWEGTILLLMSSGDFSGIDLHAISRQITHRNK